MEKLLPILMSFLVLTNFHRQQDGPIKDQFTYKMSYELTYQPDSTDAASKKKEEMFLYIGDGISRFSSAGTAIGDSLESAFDYSNFNQASFLQMKEQIPKTAFEYYIYKGIPTEKITLTREIVKDKYRTTTDKNLFDWTIHEDRDTIAGFRVQKATARFAGRNYTAWFTNEIPFPDGPYKFHGLPGLIVKIGDEKAHYVYELKRLQELKKPVRFTFREEEFLETSPEKLLELQKEYQKDPVGYIKRTMPGATIKVEYESAGQKNKIERARKERLRKANNPLELL